MAIPGFAGIWKHLGISAITKLWEIAGTIGLFIVPKMRDLILLLSGGLPDIAVAVLNLILPLLSKKIKRRADSS